MLLRHLFKTHVAKTIKTPVIPPEKPKAPDPNNKKALVDENTWLWEAFDKLIQNLERAIILFFHSMSTSRLTPPSNLRTRLTQTSTSLNLMKVSSQSLQRSSATTLKPTRRRKGNFLTKSLSLSMSPCSR